MRINTYSARERGQCYRLARPTGAGLRDAAGTGPSLLARAAEPPAAGPVRAGRGRGGRSAGGLVGVRVQGVDGVLLVGRVGGVDAGDPFEALGDVRVGPVHRDRLAGLPTLVDGAPVVAELRELADQGEPDAALVGDGALHPVPDLGGPLHELALDPLELAGELPAQLVHLQVGLGRAPALLELHDAQPSLPDHRHQPVGEDLAAAVQVLELRPEGLLELRRLSAPLLQELLEPGEVRADVGLVDLELLFRGGDPGLDDPLRLGAVRLEGPGQLLPERRVEPGRVHHPGQGRVDLALHPGEELEVLLALVLLLLPQALVEVGLEADLEVRDGVHPRLARLVEPGVELGADPLLRGGHLLVHDRGDPRVEGGAEPADPVEGLPGATVDEQVQALLELLELAGPPLVGLGQVGLEGAVEPGVEAQARLGVAFLGLAHLKVELGEKVRPELLLGLGDAGLEGLHGLREVRPGVLATLRHRGGDRVVDPAAELADAGLQPLGEPCIDGFGEGRLELRGEPRLQGGGVRFALSRDARFSGVHGGVELPGGGQLGGREARGGVVETAPQLLELRIDRLAEPAVEDRGEVVPGRGEKPHLGLGDLLGPELGLALLGLGEVVRAELGLVPLHVGEGARELGRELLLDGLDPGVGLGELPGPGLPLALLEGGHGAAELGGGLLLDGLEAGVELGPELFVEGGGGPGRRGTGEGGEPLVEDPKDLPLDLLPEGDRVHRRRRRTPGGSRRGSRRGGGRGARGRRSGRERGRRRRGRRHRPRRRKRGGRGRACGRRRGSRGHRRRRRSGRQRGGGGGGGAAFRGDGSSRTETGTTSGGEGAAGATGAASTGRESHGGTWPGEGVAGDAAAAAGAAGAGAPTSDSGSRACRYSWARFAVSAVTGTLRPRARCRRSAALSMAVPIRHISLRRSRPPCRSGSAKWERSRGVSTRSTRWLMGRSFASWWSRTYWRTRGTFSFPFGAGIPSVRSRKVTGALSQLDIRLACRSPAASPRGTRMSATARGSCSANSWRFVFGWGRKYGNARMAPRETSEAGRSRMSSRIVCMAGSHSSAATTTTGSVDPRWKRNPSPRML